MPQTPEEREPFWASVQGPQLAQGDSLTGCPVPLFPANYQSGGGQTPVPVKSANLVVITQSCDLANGKARLVALCPIFPTSQLIGTSGRPFAVDQLEEIRKGRKEGLHMLGATGGGGPLIVDFREIHSLPVEFLSHHADSVGPRWRLRSPYLEHFSQGFARFFMRVGLPAAIPPFKK